ncbi:hypothetical protein Tco_0775452 [Tanacetum coccineum]
MAELYVTKASHWWKPTRRDMVALKEAHGEMDFCTKRLTKEAQGLTHGYCHCWLNPCAPPRFKSTVKIKDPIMVCGANMKVTRSKYYEDRAIFLGSFFYRLIIALTITHNTKHTTNRV